MRIPNARVGPVVTRFNFKQLVIELRALLALLNGKQLLPSIPNSILPNVNPNVEDPYSPYTLTSHPSTASTLPTRNHTLTPRHTLTHGKLLPVNTTNAKRTSVFTFDVGETEDPWKISYRIDLNILQGRENGKRNFGPGLSSRKLSRSRTLLRETPFPTLENLPRGNQMTQMTQAPVFTQPKSLLQQATETLLQKTAEETARNLGSHRLDSTAEGLATADSTTADATTAAATAEGLATAAATAEGLTKPTADSTTTDATAEGLATADSTTADATAKGLATEDLSDSDSIAEGLPTSSDILPAVRTAALEVLKQDEERSELLKEFLDPKRIAWWFSTATAEDSVSDSARAGTVDSASVDSPSSVAESAFPDIAEKLLSELENDYHNDDRDDYRYDVDYHVREFSLRGISDKNEWPMMMHLSYMKGLFETTDTEKWFESWERRTLRRQKEMYGTSNDELERLFLAHKEILKELGSPKGGVFIANDAAVPAFMFMLSQFYLESQVPRDGQDSVLGRMARQGRQFLSKTHVEKPSRNWDDLPPEEMLLRSAARKLREARRLCLTEFFSQSDSQSDEMMRSTFPEMMDQGNDQGNIAGTDGRNLNPGQINAGTDNNNAATDNNNAGTDNISPGRKDNNAGKVPPRECFLLDEEDEIHAKIVALWRQRHNDSGNHNDKILKVANVKFMSLEFLEQYEHGFFVASIMLRQIFDYALKRQQSLEEQETAMSEWERITYDKKLWEEYEKKMAAIPPLTQEEKKKMREAREKARNERVRKSVAKQQRREEAKANAESYSPEERKRRAEKRLKFFKAKREKAKEKHKKEQEEKAKKFEDWRNGEGLKPEERKRARETKVLLTGKERREIITVLEQAEIVARKKQKISEKSEPEDKKRARVAEDLSTGKERTATLAELEPRKKQKISEEV